MSDAKQREGDAQIAHAIEARDFEAARRLLGRWMSPNGRRRLHDYVTEELGRRSAADFACAYRGGRNQVERQLMRELLEGWLGAPDRHEHARAIVEALPNEGAIAQLRVTWGIDSIDELRAKALGSGLPDPVIFALVRRQDAAWLFDRARAGELSARALAALADVWARDGADPRRLIHLAFELTEGSLLAAVLERFDVDPRVVADALQRPEPEVHAAAMRHAHRLPEPAVVLRGGLRHADARVRRAALRALVDRPLRELLPDVRALVDDPDPWDERYNPEPVGELARQLLPRLR